MHTDTRGGRQLGAHTVVLKRDGVVTGMRFFGLVIEARTIAAVWLVDVARLEAHIAADGLQ